MTRDVEMIPKLGPKPKKVKPPCSVEGCSAPVLARGWCGRHYARWRQSGDPEALHPRLKGDPNSPAVEARMINGTLVYFTEDGRTYSDVVRRGKVERRYGETFTCQTCKKETFARYSGANRFQFCSHKCAGPVHRKKLGMTHGKPSVTKTKEALDRMFGAIIRQPAVCVACGSTSDHQCAHGFSRRYLTVRWDPRNAFCLCRGCHMKYTHRPLEWDEWLRSRWGDDLYWELRHLALSTDIKVDYDAKRIELIGIIRERDITLNRMPKAIAGWVGLTNTTDDGRVVVLEAELAQLGIRHG